MTPWWLVMLGGLLGSTHCIGMCGGFAALVGLNTGTLAANVRSQLVYSLGRILSYAALGGAAGYAGQRLMAAVPVLVNAPAILCLVAGAVLIREGLLATGWWKPRVARASVTGCLMKPLFSTIIRTPGLRNALTAGILTGFLPCGLVYAFVSLAASSGDFLQGIAIMAAFGAGTIPLMVATGCGVSMIAPQTRAKLWKLAAWSVVVTGLLTAGRGVTFLQAPSDPAAPRCPFCSAKSCPAPEAIGGDHE
jgi:sulfite exporter TauE/SafE